MTEDRLYGTEGENRRIADGSSSVAGNNQNRVFSRLVNYSNTAWQLSSYIPFASATFIYVGCGRAIYTLDLSKIAMVLGGFQVEVLVCNYGPVDRTASQQLYTLGRPGLCPLGTLLSDRYPSLCNNNSDSVLFVHASAYRLFK
ncbi:PREDICTED: uncharacterized protein LOC105150629 [Acromyrmex echinatior]|uniref:uncharacterized protein LOC105150629 n=1 Tax=Acromyrmex echinatior TaxID=103372 RepID=UPI000580B621|nr:PREDICTED: uncharacterized protein LOC105150629 [Acromyrmex echinatior]